MGWPDAVFMIVFIICLTVTGLGVLALCFWFDRH